MSTLRPTTLRRWPFWLLIAAWFCANTPQAALPHVLDWIKGAKHFSHEAELRGEVAALLAGQPETPAAHFTAAPAPSRPAAPALPAEATLKKIDLATTGDAFCFLIPHAAIAWPVFSSGTRCPHVADVPHLPPRAVVTA